MKTLGIIPARYASSRFPGKPLADVAGKTMIQRVYEQAAKSTLDELIVATDDERIMRHVADFGGKAVMTAAQHASGTDRCAEVAGLGPFAVFDLIINVQGDEPFIQPQQINLVADYLSGNPGCHIATLVKRIGRHEEIFNPHVVKVVFGSNRKALYFSRSPIPCLRGKAHEEWIQYGEFYKHIGLYGFRRDILMELAKLPPGVLEEAESLEQLRWLENGYSIGIEITALETKGIDTPEDLNEAAASFKQ